MISEFIEFISDIETPSTNEYINITIGVISVGCFFILFISVVNYICTIGISFVVKQVGI